VGKRPGTLKRYEGGNLLFLLLVVIALGVFVSYVFVAYRSPGKRLSWSDEVAGVLSDATAPDSDVCMFYLGTRVSEAALRYEDPEAIPATDDGLVRDLFSIPGVVEVVVDKTLVILRKSPAVPWERVRPSAREIINHHLHAHH